MRSHLLRHAKPLARLLVGTLRQRRCEAIRSGAFLGFAVLSTSKIEPDWA